MSISRSTANTLPCRHSLDVTAIGKAKRLLADMPNAAPGAIAAAGIDPADWDILLRAAVESMRGTNSATATDKRRFIAAVLDHARRCGVLTEWSFIGSGGRQDYRVEMPDGKLVAIESKGCPDGNNTNIWDRPSWADEFIVWFLCPESLAHPAGEGLWSGIATRLMPKMAAERKVVDTVLFFDGRCGSHLRQCPKSYGVDGPLRANATDIRGDAGAPDWTPPPCVYLMPRSYPTVPSNPAPRLWTLEESTFARAILTAFGVPADQQPEYVHEAGIVAQGTTRGMRIQVTVTSRCWPDGEPRLYQGKFKSLKRE
jgi:hypothetical protein